MGIVALSYATGGLSADLLQLYAIQVLGLSPAQVGLALGALVLSIPFQLRATRLAHRWGKKTLMRRGYIAALALLVPLALLPALGSRGDAPLFAAFVIVVLAIEIVISSSWGVAWHPWMQEITSPADRGRFLSRMRFTTQTFNFAITLVFGVLVGKTVSAAEYDALLGVLGVYLLFAVAQLSQIPEPSREGVAETPAGNPETKGRIKADLRELAHDRRLRLLSLIFVIDTFTLVPLFVTYAVKELNYDAGTVATIVALRSFASTIALLAWGRRIDRRGWPLTMSMAILLTGLSMLGWLFVTPQADDNGTLDAAVLGAVVVVGGVFSAGYGVALLSGWYDTAPERASVTFFTLRDIAASTKLQLFFFLSGVAITALAPIEVYESSAVHIDGYKLFLFIGAPAAVVAAIIARRLDAIGTPGSPP